jgi:hypothetical protein
MKGGLSMYLLRNACLEQISTETELQHKPTIDLRIHWINPLLHKCKKRLYQDAWRAVKQSGTSSPDEVL